MIDKPEQPDETPRRPRPTRDDPTPTDAAPPVPESAAAVLPRQTRSVLTWAVVGLAIVCVALITTVAILVPVWLDYRDTNAARASALRAAQQYAVDFGSYDYRHLDADFAKVASHLTPDFKKSYLASSSRLEPTIVQYHGTSVATVQGVGLTSATTGKAKAVVLLDQKITTSQSSTPRIDRNRLEMTLVHRHGSWLIDKLVLK
jgi:Mce-associated membrane protein